MSDAQLTLAGDTDWLLTDAGGVKRLALSGAHQLVLRHVPDLVSVTSDSPALSLRIEEAPALEQVEGTGHTFTLHRMRSALRRLCIDGSWEHARLNDPGLRHLRLASGKSLTLQNCGALGHIELPLAIEIDCHGALPSQLAHRARFYFDESSLTSCFEQFEQGDATQLDSIVTVLANAHERPQVVLSLQRIIRLCELGVAPELVWQTRRTLAARHLSRRRLGQTPPSASALSHADSQWLWNFPADLAEQGWEADLLVWRYCHEQVAAAAAYGGVMSRCADREHALHVLVRVSGDARADAVLFRQAIQTLKHRLGAKPPPPIECTHGGALRLARLLSHPSACPSAQGTVVDYLLATMPLKQFAPVLQSILHLAPGLFRSKLMALAHKPDQWFNARVPGGIFGDEGPQLIQRHRQRLLALALAPVAAGSTVAHAPPHPTGDLALQLDLPL